MNYYRNILEFRHNMGKSIARRLVSDLRFKLYSEQKGLCLICKRLIGEKELIRRDAKIHIYHLVVLKSVKELAELSYGLRLNKVLLHKRCHLQLYKLKDNVNFHIY
jgi:hypothetical protein